MTKVQEHINKDHEEKIGILFNHADVANHEMSVVKTDIAILKTEFIEMKNAIKGVNVKQWAIIAMIIGSAIAIIFER